MTSAPIRVPVHSELRRHCGLTTVCPPRRRRLREHRCAALVGGEGLPPDPDVPRSTTPRDRCLSSTAGIDDNHWEDLCTANSAR